MAIRKNANDLTAAERLELVTALKTLKANGRYNLYVMRHAQAPPAAIHRSPAFLPWHRAFILDLEKELQQVSGNAGLGLPYWNWSEGGVTASIWDDDLMGGNGDPADNDIVKTGPFRQGEWTIVTGLGNPAGPLIREFGVHPRCARRTRCGRGSARPSSRCPGGRRRPSSSRGGRPSRDRTGRSPCGSGDPSARGGRG